MSNVLIDPGLSPDELRDELYAGSLVILTRLSSVAELVEHARLELTQLLSPHDPQHVHEHFSPEQMAGILGQWKPRFIHSERSRGFVRDIIKEAGFPADHTHFDLPKPRTSFPVGHLTTGIAFAFPWHRDVWYSAPRQQINWWLPVFPVRGDNAMEFDLTKFAKPVFNTSADFDYYSNNVSRLTTARQVIGERQARPAAEGHEQPHSLTLLPAPGQVLLFSGAQLHKSIPNTSGLARYSIDFRTVDARDLLADRGAPLVDVSCTGTAVRDFVSVADESHFDEETVRALFGPPPDGAMLVFETSASGESA
ncbi:MAG: hypothetical protein JWM19_3483 [Actinomycetia bacterium]|nr:hypothetical protein [Actinomycetes bacterium]